MIDGDSTGMGVFASFSIVEIVSRFKDSRNFDRKTSATSSEPRVLFSALEKQILKKTEESFDECRHTQDYRRILNSS